MTMSEVLANLLRVDPDYRPAQALDMGNQEALVLGARIFGMLGTVSVELAEVETPVIDGESTFDHTIDLGIKMLKTPELLIGFDRYVQFNQLPYVSTQDEASFVKPIKNGFQMTVTDYNSDPLAVDQCTFRFSSYDPLIGTIHAGEELEDETILVGEKLKQLTAFLRDLEPLAVEKWLETLKEMLGAYPEIVARIFIENKPKEELG